MDKNQAIIDFLMTCPDVAKSPLFFNAINAKDNDKQFVTTGNSKVKKTFVNGEELKYYTFTIIDYRSVAYTALTTVAGLGNENIAELKDVQRLIDWIDAQNELHNFPYFGSNCVVQSMSVGSDTPKLNGIDTSVTPQLAKYSISIQIEYIDRSKCLY